MIQPGAVGDGILTIPLIKFIREQAGIDHVDIMGHLEYLEVLGPQTAREQMISLEGTELHPLFRDHDEFDLPEGHPLIDLFRPYELIVSFLGEPGGHFESNLIYTASMTHAADVATLRLRPPDDYHDHTAYFFMEQFVSQIPGSQLRLSRKMMSLPRICPDTQQEQEAKEILARKGMGNNREIVALHPGSGGKDKCWPLEEFQHLAELLNEQNRQSIILLGPVERERWGVEVIDRLKTRLPVLEDLSLTQVAAVLNRCTAYVGNDSGISHLAGALGVPTVAVFGPSNACHWRPLGVKVRVCRPDSSDSFWPKAQPVLNQLAELIV